MGRGYAWLETGTPDSLLDAADFVRLLENGQRFKVVISDAEMEWAIAKHGKSDYGRYLCGIMLTGAP